VFNLLKLSLSALSLATVFAPPMAFDRSIAKDVSMPANLPEAGLTPILAAFLFMIPWDPINACAASAAARLAYASASTPSLAWW
jgi:hypothetical protein